MVLPMGALRPLAARRLLTPAPSSTSLRLLSSSSTLRAAAASAPPPSAAAAAAAAAESSSAAVGAEGKDPQLGDYPDFPAVSMQKRKADPSWWDPQEKKMFGETLHEEEDILSVWAPDVHPTPASSALRQFLLAALGAATFAGLIYASFPGRPTVPRTYPREGLKEELGGVAAPAEGAFDAKPASDDDDEDDE